MSENTEAYVERLSPSGANSTHFTTCCGTAICDDQCACPNCGKNVIGFDVDSAHERGRIRWSYATSHWNRKAR